MLQTIAKLGCCAIVGGSQLMVQAGGTARAAPPQPTSVATPPVAAATLSSPPRPIPGDVMKHWPLYPPEARRLGEEGLVRLRVAISAQGLPGDISIAESSRFPSLDEAAVRAVRDWRFVPATRNGQPIAATAILPLRFSLKAEAPAAKPGAVGKPPTPLAKVKPKVKTGRRGSPSSAHPARAPQALPNADAARPADPSADN